MILIVCATEFELQPLLERIAPKKGRWDSLVTGVGVVETTLCLSRFLEQRRAEFSAVLHIGVAGAYFPPSGEGAKCLDICLAEKEFFGDFGICYQDSIAPLGEELIHKSAYTLDGTLLQRAAAVLQKEHIQFFQGTFVTVAGVSATHKRGEMLQKQYGALCENMEGAAVARVCDAFSLPLLEMRSISNYVEDRDTRKWKLKEASQKSAACAALVLEELVAK